MGHAGSVEISVVNLHLMELGLGGRAEFGSRSGNGQEALFEKDLNIFASHAGDLHNNDQAVSGFINVHRRVKGPLGLVTQRFHLFEKFSHKSMDSASHLVKVIDRHSSLPISRSLSI
ncbi:MAG: hypothetical protein KKH04_16975 [Proteobacteria bacterium]|nr:hypothetical protein [Pseudomonadota bacterium]